jgi:hypothetical protein
MSNTLLTINMITKEALRVLHQKCNFINNVNRSYDDRYANEGAKIGDSLRIRLPVRYTATIGTSASISVQNTVEENVNLTVQRRGQVAMRFTSQEMTLSLDDFSNRIIKPAVSVLAAGIEADALSMTNSVYNSVNNLGAALNFRQTALAAKRLDDSLAPDDDQRVALLNTQDRVDFVDSTKGLFQSSANIAQQYKRGVIGTTSGFDFYQNTLMPTSTTGTMASATTMTVSGADQVGSVVNIVAGGALTNTFAVGDIVTFAGCFEVHPETKASTGRLQQFVVTATATANGTTPIALSISPAIVTSTGRQNVSASPTNGGAVVKVGAASQVYRPSLFFHPDAFAFATADLEMPRGVDMASRQVMDGISMRIVRQYDISEDRMPCRIDVLYGYQAIRPELATRVLSN